MSVNNETLMQPTEPSLALLARVRNLARQRVEDWMSNEGQQGRLRVNHDCPHWAAYEDAENALAERLAKV